MHTTVAGWVGGVSPPHFSQLTLSLFLLLLLLPSSARSPPRSAASAWAPRSPTSRTSRSRSSPTRSAASPSTPSAGCTRRSWWRTSRSVLCVPACLPARPKRRWRACVFFFFFGVCVCDGLYQKSLCVLPCVCYGVGCGSTTTGTDFGWVVLEGPRPCLHQVLQRDPLPIRSLPQPNQCWGGGGH